MCIVNNAGVGSVRFLTEMTPEHLQNHFGINVFGTLDMTQAVVNLGKMPPGGRIINVGSCASKMGPGDGMGVYGATKAATDSLTASWAWEVSKKIFFSKREFCSLCEVADWIGITTAWTQPWYHHQ